MSDQSFGERLNRAAQDMRKMGEALAEQPPRYSHRNGETEPPIVDGYYWYDTSERNDLPWVFGMIDVNDSIAFTATGEQLRLGDCEGQWWGPVTPPWVAD